MNDIAEGCANRILKAKRFTKPFKYVVIDNFLPKYLVDTCYINFPSKEEKIWEKSNDKVEKKLRSNYKSEFDFPYGLKDAVGILNSSHILNAMSEALGIPKLIPDPYFTGGGLNMSFKGGMLDVHVDGNYHDATGLNRRVNAILFLNPDWNESWGGEFGIYEDEGKTLVKKIYPIMNRLVIFDTNDNSFHGTPDPITCPRGEDRKSLILYYYTVAERENVRWDKPHSALWRKNNLTDKKGKTEREYK